LKRITLNKNVVSALILVLLMSLFTACSNSETSTKGSNNQATNDPQSSSGEKTTITVRTAMAGDAEKVKREWFEKQIKKFEAENPEFLVEAEYVNTEAHRNKLKVEMAGGNPPDLFQTWGLSYSESFANNGMMLDLTEEFKNDPEWKDSFLPIALESYTYNGKIMGVSTGGPVEGIYYNKELFKKFGLNPPNTYEDFIKAIDVAKENNLIPIAVGLKESYVSDWNMGAILQRMGGTEFFNEIMEGKGSFVNPDYIRAIKWIQDLAEMDVFPEGALGVANAQGRSLFGNGKALMHFSGSWTGSAFYSEEFPEGTGDKIGFVNIPNLPGGKGDQNKIRAAFSPGLAISGKVTGHVKEGVVKLLKTISSKESLVEYAPKNYALPSVKADVSDFKNTTTLYQEIVQAKENSSGLFTTFNDLMPPGMAEVYYNVLASAMSKSNKETPEELLAKLDQAYKDFSK
jgi:raffinose/stachyose/melibiose transport system substrate-binding protein